MATSRKTRSAPRKASEPAPRSSDATTSNLTELPVQDLASINLDASTAYVRGLQLAFEFWKDGAAGWVEFNEAAWKAAGQWFGEFAKDGAGLQRIEAEVDHVVNPWTASPFAWPAQEATRQAMTLATSAWNDWLTWQAGAAGVSRDAESRR
jgi:hypothetical protein